MNISREYALHEIDSGEFVYAFICMQKLGHHKDRELGYNMQFSFSRAKSICLSLISTLSMHSPGVLLSPSLCASLSSSWYRGKNHRKCVMCDPGCHWLARRKGRVKQKPSECPLVAKHSDDGQLMEGRLRRDQRVCFFVQNITAVLHM